VTREEFIAGYCERHQCPPDGLEAIPCECGLELCQGWRMRPTPSAQSLGEADSTCKP
jgi:hypothetical protein